MKYISKEILNNSKSKTLCEKVKKELNELGNDLRELGVGLDYQIEGSFLYDDIGICFSFYVTHNCSRGYRKNLFDVILSDEKNCIENGNYYFKFNKYEVFEKALKSMTKTEDFIENVAEMAAYGTLLSKTN
ncbi:MAG: hypothetical protein ACRCX2_19095 [Paraclostridium sp.]